MRHRVVTATLSLLVGLAAALQPLSPAASSVSSEITDMWWNPAESGWGVNVGGIARAR